METATQYIPKVGVVLSGTMSHVIVSYVRKGPLAKNKGEGIN